MTIQTILDHLDSAETIGAEIASKLAPWLAPLLSAVVVGQAVLKPPFSWAMWQAVLLGATLELMGIAVLSTAMLLYSYRTRQPSDRKPPVMPFVLSVGSVAVYALTVASITVALKLPVLAGYGEWVIPFVYIGVLLLAIVSAVNLTIRRDHYRLTQQPKPATKPRKLTAKQTSRKRPTDQSGDERLANLAAANAKRQPSQADYNRAAHLRAEGLTWGAVADEIGRSVTTAKAWAGKAEETDQAGDPPGDSIARLVDALPMDQTGKDAIRQAVNGQGGAS